MKLSLCGLFMGLLAGCATSAPQPDDAPKQRAAGAESASLSARPEVNTAAQREALTHHLQTFLNVQAADWTEGDLEGFCAVYAEDAVFISPKGKTVGRQQIFDRYHQRYREGDAEMGTLTLGIEDIRLGAHGDMASIAMRWKLVFAETPEASGLSLITLSRTGPVDEEGQPAWQIVQDASM